MDDRGKAIARRSVTCKMTFYYQSAACSLHFAPGLQSAFCADRISIAVSVESQVQLELEKQFLVGLSWPL